LASAKPTIFPYKFAGGRLSPVVSIGIEIQGQWQVAECYVDSGAFYTLLHAQFAVDFGLDFKSGRKMYVQVGDGSLIPMHLHKLSLQIGGKQLKATVGFF